MKALYYRGPTDIRYERAPDPSIEHPADVIVSVQMCGICGSDMHIYHGFIPEVEGCTIGHEAVGEVVEVGSAVTAFRAGDRLMLSALVGCGECASCLAGETLRCRNGAVRGYGLGHGLAGCQAEAVRVPQAASNARRIPEGVSTDQALLLTDNLSTAYAACLRADITRGRSAAIIGLGPIGLMAVEIALHLGANPVFAIDPVEERRAVAESLGAAALTPSLAADHIREATRGLMVDSVVEAVGGAEPLKTAFALVGKTRTISVLGVGGPSVIDFPPEALLHGITFRAMIATEVMRYWDDLIPLLRDGALRPERFITHRARLSEGAELYLSADRKVDGIIKTVLLP